MKGVLAPAVRWIVRSLACLGFIVVAATLIPSQWYGGFLAGPWTEPHGNVLVVLSSDSLGNGSLGDSTFWRCVYAVDVWHESGFKYLVLSGDAATTSAMRDYLIYRGIPGEAIVAENRSSTTRENAVIPPNWSRE